MKELNNKNQISLHRINLNNEIFSDFVLISLEEKNTRTIRVRRAYLEKSGLEDQNFSDVFQN
jgi:hypothetical protein